MYSLLSDRYSPGSAFTYIHVSRLSLSPKRKDALLNLNITCYKRSFVTHVLLMAPVLVPKP